MAGLVGKHAVKLALATVRRLRRPSPGLDDLLRMEQRVGLDSDALHALIYPPDPGEVLAAFMSVSSESPAPRNRASARRLEVAPRPARRADQLLPTGPAGRQTADIRGLTDAETLRRQRQAPAGIGTGRPQDAPRSALAQAAQSALSSRVSDSAGGSLDSTGSVRSTIGQRRAQLRSALNDQSAVDSPGNRPLSAIAGAQSVQDPTHTARPHTVKQVQRPGRQANRPDAPQAAHSALSSRVSEAAGGSLDSTGSVGSSIGQRRARLRRALNDQSAVDSPGNRPLSATASAQTVQDPTRTARPHTVTQVQRPGRQANRPDAPVEHHALVILADERRGPQPQNSATGPWPGAGAEPSRSIAPGKTPTPPASAALSAASLTNPAHRSQPVTEGESKPVTEGETKTASQPATNQQPGPREGLPSAHKPGQRSQETWLSDDAVELAEAAWRNGVDAP